MFRSITQVLFAPDPDPTGGAPGAAGGAPPTPAVVPPVTPPAKDVEVDAAWLKGRLEQSTRAGETKLLKALGFDKAEDAVAALAELKTIREEKLTAEQKTALRLAELEPAAKRATDLESTVKLYSDREFGTLTEAQQSAVKAVAGDDPARILRTIEALKGTWTTPAAPVAPVVPTAPAPASTTAAPPAPPAAGGSSQVDHKAEWKRIQSINPIEGARYLQTHGAAIHGTT